MSQKSRVTEVATAVQIVRAAALKVINTPKIVGYECHKKHEGRLTVEAAANVTDQQMKEIESISNQIISQKLEIKTTIIPKAQAETGHKALVEEIFKHPKYFVPQYVQEVELVEIPNWSRTISIPGHLKVTSEVRPIKVVRTNFKDAKKELEIIFEFSEENSNTSASQPSASSKKAQSSKPKTSSPNDDVNSVTEKLVDEILELTKKEGPVDKDKEEALRIALRNTVQHRLTLLKNTAYTRGFTVAAAKHAGETYTLL